MHLLWFLAIGPWMFVWAFIGSGLLEFTDGDEWWAFPLYMAVGVPAFLVCIAGILGFIALGFGATA